MQVAKWGNSLAIRLPASVVAALELVPGDEIEITVMGAREMRVARKASSLEALKSLRRFRGAMPADFKFDRDDAAAR
ncbi:MAG: AbrB/MazE/SpoVT family DNA-binding domain-containing protein [Burkholderiales bacterium]|nr:AbrB/MazE/SpoVT family DNA-binding domain-containing protein [Burkholderiales bacterium]